LDIAGSSPVLSSNWRRLMIEIYGNNFGTFVDKVI
jgi:hypothetical protein